ncbi:unnamed protein product [Adineta ricciae]|uniref:Uncharacterized protein n=1 Tax=Adineta ricciae TaxID=249248 RepID=A0A815ZR01_ADIRI|nr:unnamed protein product [Adineta ricciae]
MTNDEPRPLVPQQAVDILLDKPKHNFKSKDQQKLFEHEVTNEEMNLAAKYGRFPQRPSDLFLKLFYGVICTLEHNPMAGCVSPALVGTSGVIPLTVISTIADIMRHYSHEITHAEK